MKHLKDFFAACLTLQQILALKFLGFPLDEIRACLRLEPREVGQVLARQQAMMRDRRRQLDTIVRALDRAQRRLEGGGCNWQEIAGVIQVIQMEQQREWTKKYFTEDGLEKMRELGEASYSEEARQKLAQREWTEEDQERAGAQWAHVAAESQRLADLGADPAGEEAQAVAKIKSDLLAEFTQGDPEIEAGLKRLWQNHNALPQHQQPLREAVPTAARPGQDNAASRLMERAMEIYRAGKG